jgi:hypothetical protein
MMFPLRIDERNSGVLLVWRTECEGDDTERADLVDFCHMRS